MTFNVSTESLNAEAEAFISKLNSGTAELRTGSQPASTSDTATGTLLATISLPATALDGPASGGVADLAATTAVAAVAAGTAGWIRFKRSGGTVVAFDGSVSESGGGGDVIIDSVTIAVNDLVNIAAMSYTRT